VECFQFCPHSFFNFFGFLSYLLTFVRVEVLIHMFGSPNNYKLSSPLGPLCFVIMLYGVGLRKLINSFNNEFYMLEIVCPPPQLDYNVKGDIKDM
jgi:hypothetical protein